MQVKHISYIQSLQMYIYFTSGDWIISGNYLPRAVASFATLYHLKKKKKKRHE